MMGGPIWCTKASVSGSQSWQSWCHEYRPLWVRKCTKCPETWSILEPSLRCSFVWVCHSLSFYCDDCDGIQWYLVSLVCPWDLNGIYKVFQAVPCSCFCWNALGIGCQKLWCSQRVSRCHCVINRWPWRNRGIAENDHPASIDWDGCKLMQALKSS